MGQMDEVSAQIGRLTALVEGLTTKVDRIEADVAALKDIRSKGWGLLGGLGLATGALGAKVAALVGNGLGGGQ